MYVQRYTYMYIFQYLFKLFFENVQVILKYFMSFSILFEGTQSTKLIILIQNSIFLVVYWSVGWLSEIGTVFEN